MSQRPSKNKLYFTMRQAADLIGEPVDTLRFVLKREKACRKRCGRYVTTRDQLLAAFPEAYRLLA